MNTHQIALNLSSAQIEILHEAYQKVLINLENAYFLTAQQLNQLRPLMREALESQAGFAEIYQKAELHHCNLQLIHSDNRLLNLPWRIAVQERERLYITCGTKANKTHFEPKKSLPLKILVMVSSPEDLTSEGRLNYESEEQQIIQAFGPLFEHGKVQIDFTDDGSLESLENKLKTNRYHILHFSGHGIFDESGKYGEENTGYLLLEDERTLNKKLVSALDFAKSINKQEQNRPDLILLSSCQTAQGGHHEGGFNGVANKLLEAGIPAVVAMGFSILDKFATSFAAELYRQLAEETELCQSFQEALQKIKQLEAPMAQQRGRVPSQWIIPQLYLGQPVESLVDWTAAFEQLKFNSLKLATGEERLLLEERPGYLFIGRRKERKEAQNHLAGEQKAVLLRGMGGVGKTALAEHLLGRMVAHDPGVQPFVVNEKELSSLESLIKQMQAYLQKQHKKFLIHTETAKYEKALDQVNFLLGELDEVCRPVFLFDNLESFQQGPGEAFKEANSDVLEVLQLLMQLQAFPVILTGRYPLQEFPEISQVDLNSVGRSDFYKKCLQLTFKEILQQSQEQRKRLGEQAVSFDQLVDLLHQTLGGNYRALEYFDELYQEKKTAIKTTLEKLEDFQAQLKKEIQENIQEKLNSGARDLIFRELYDLLNENQQEILALLSGYRIPVLELALKMQGLNGELKPDLERLRSLNLIEKHIQATEKEDLVYIYVPPLLRSFLDQIPLSRSIDHQQAGRYFEYVDRAINHLNYSDLEEAFLHYVKAKEREAVNKIGDQLCSFYYDVQLFVKSFFYGTTTERLLGEATDGRIWSHLGLIHQLYGNLDAAIHYQENFLRLVQKRQDKQGEGATLNNIGQIYDAKGDYDTALEYLEKSFKIQNKLKHKVGDATSLSNLGSIAFKKGDYDQALSYFNLAMKIDKGKKDLRGESISLNNISQIYSAKGDYDTALLYMKRDLEICQEIGDRSGEGTTLNNISQIYDAKGDYDTALSYLEQSLRISQEIGDRSGEGTNLNNISQIYDAKGDYDTALSYLEQSLRISQEIGYIRGAATTMNNIGATLFQGKDQPEAAIPYLMQAYQIRQQIGVPEVNNTISWLNLVIEQIGEARFQEIISQTTQNS